MSDQPINGIVAPHAPSISVSRTSTEVNHTGSWKYIRPAYHDRVAPCIAACPTGVDIAGYMSLLRQNRIDEACELLLRENPMPAVTGRVCDHPCESDCNRALFDGAIAIHAVERVLGDRILATPLPAAVTPTQAEKIAVIGSGPAGLACAYHLARLGYPVELFEDNALPGGMLRTGIPAYRLPRDVLNAQIARIEALGVRIHCGVRAGMDLPWETLTSEFTAIFIATGAQISKALGVDAAENSKAIWSGLDFLRKVNNGERPNVGHHVVVIGGGNTAMDCARAAIRLGAEVTVVYRRTRAEMPAIAEEVADAELEGVQFAFLAAPQRVIAANSRITLICKRMRLGAPGPDGRATVMTSPDAGFPLEVDTIISAIGEDPNQEALPPELRAAESIMNDEWGCSRIDNIFVGGDLAGDVRTVSHALGAGKRAAIGIDRYVRTCKGESFADDLIDNLSLAGDGALSMVRWRGDDPVHRVAPLNDVVPFDDINTAHFEPAYRHPDRKSHHIFGFEETNAGLSHDTALGEAARCFECGVCNECELCHTYCGDAAIKRTAGDAHFEIDMEYCKGCGVCATECPRGCIVMESGRL